MKAKLALRLATAAVAIPALVWIVGWGGALIFSCLIALVAVIALFEYAAMAFPAKPAERALAIAAGAVLAAGVLLGGLAAIAPWLGGVTVALFSVYLFFGGALDERFRRLAWTLLGALYIGYLVPHGAVVYQMADGPRWMFFVLIAVMMGDTAAYFVGTAIGRRKLAPEISPGKTVEGAVASTAATLAAGALAGHFFLPARSWPEILTLSLVISALGQVGDLFESWIKRVFGVKDSGALLPGHGGLLDRVDSLIFPLVFVAYYLRAVQP